MKNRDLISCNICFEPHDSEMDWFEDKPLDFIWRRILNRVDEVVRDLKFREGISQAAYLECVFRKSRGLLYGSHYKEDEEWEGTQLQRSEKEIFANLGSLENLKDFMLKMIRVLHWAIADEFLNLSDSMEYRRSIRVATLSQDWEAVESLIMPIAIAILGRAAVLFHGVGFAAALLVSLVYQYLTGLFDKGSTRTYSAGSLEFRSTYISLVLFQGAYVWIKFRDVAPPSLQRPSPGLHRRSRMTEDGVREYHGNYEPRFKPPGVGGKYVYVGFFEEEEVAKIMYQIVAFYYGKGDGKLVLLGGAAYIISPMTEQEQRKSGQEKIQLVQVKAKVEYNNYMELMVSSLIMDELPPLSDHLDLPPDLPDTNTQCGDQGQGDSVGLGNQADGFVSGHPNNCSPNFGPDTQGMQHGVDGTVSGQGLGMQQFDARATLTSRESSMGLLPRTVPNDPGCTVAGPSEQRLEFQYHHRTLQEYHANNSTTNVISEDLSLQRQVRELQRQQELENLRQQNQISELQLQNQQHENRISELQDEIESLRNTERVCKRCCYGITFRGAG